MDKFLSTHLLAPVTRAIFCDYLQEEGVLNLCPEGTADAIAMLTHGRNGIMCLPDGSVTESVVNRA